MLGLRGVHLYSYDAMASRLDIEDMGMDSERSQSCGYAEIHHGGSTAYKQLGFSTRDLV